MEKGLKERIEENIKKIQDDFDVSSKSQLIGKLIYTIGERPVYDDSAEYLHSEAVVIPGVIRGLNEEEKEFLIVQKGGSELKLSFKTFFQEYDLYWFDSADKAKEAIKEHGKKLPWHSKEEFMTEEEKVCEMF